VAGKEYTESSIGKWIRPVSARSEQDIAESECRCNDGAGVHLLDVVRISCVRPIPLGHQQENILIESAVAWQRIGKYPTQQIHRLLDHPKTLWTNNSQSRKGINDRVATEDIKTCKTSLYLIVPEQLALVVIRFWVIKYVRALFIYNGETYNLKVTDIFTEEKYKAMECGEYPITPVPMCISLADIYDKDMMYYKLAAAIFMPREA
jgi:hypothetical protein